MCEWKEKWKLNKDPPEWVSDDNWLGYDLMWKDEKVQAKSSTNSTNRKSERGGFGIAIHNTGAKSYERRKDEMVNYTVKYTLANCSYCGLIFLVFILVRPLIMEGKSLIC